MHEKLYQLFSELRLSGMAHCFDDLLIKAQTEKMAHSDFLLLLLEVEYQRRMMRHLQNKFKKSKLPDWELSSFPFDTQPSIDRCQVNNLAKLDFIRKAINLNFIGAPGTGKTGLAIGLFRLALAHGFSGQFYDAQDLLDELYTSLADKTSKRLLKRLARYDVLVIDGLRSLELKAEHINLLFRLIESRYQKKATIMTTTLDYPKWYEVFKNKELVDGMIDRFCHYCITIKIDGSSLRIPTELTTLSTEQKNINT